MDNKEYTLEKISYSRKEDCRIMESVLKVWFQDPKTLNLASPYLTYPFNFRDWLSKSYSDSQFRIISLVIKKESWIVGHVSYRIEKYKVYIFHLIIDKNYRRLGLAKKLICKIEEFCHDKQKTIILKIFKKNREAIDFFINLNYTITTSKNTKSIKMKKL